MLTFLVLLDDLWPVYITLIRLILGVIPLKAGPLERVRFWSRDSALVVALLLRVFFALLVLLVLKLRSILSVHLLSVFSVLFQVATPARFNRRVRQEFPERQSTSIPMRLNQLTHYGLATLDLTYAVKGLSAGVS